MDILVISQLKPFKNIIWCQTFDQLHIKDFFFTEKLY